MDTEYWPDSALFRAAQQEPRRRRCLPYLQFFHDLDLAILSQGPCGKFGWPQVGSAGAVRTLDRLLYRRLFDNVSPSMRSRPCSAGIVKFHLVQLLVRRSVGSGLVTASPPSRTIIVLVGVVSCSRRIGEEVLPNRP